MKENTMKIMLLLITFILLSIITMTPVMAGYTPPVIEPESSGATGKIENAGGQVAGIVAAIAAGVAIVILIWLAIKYMTGSASDKADIKKSAIPYVIGAVLLFAASGVLTLIQAFGSGLFSEGGGGSGTSYPRDPDPGTIEMPY